MEAAPEPAAAAPAVGERMLRAYSDCIDVADVGIFRCDPAGTNAEAVLLYIGDSERCIATLLAPAADDNEERLSFMPRWLGGAKFDETL